MERKKSFEASADSNQQIIEKRTSGCYVKARYVLAIMGSLACFNTYTMRYNLSIAIVAMVNRTQANASSYNINGNTSIAVDTCPERSSLHDNELTKESANGIFNWNPVQQGLVLGCYFYGYLCSNVIGGWLSKRFGFKLILGASVLLSSIVSILTPVAARTSFELFVCLRILLGFFAGVTFPTMQTAFATWAPPLEKSTLTSIQIAGCQLALLLTMFVGGLICEKLGWDSLFYITGGIAIVWTIAWYYLVYDSPFTHPRISPEEKAFITKNIGITENDAVRTATPWLAIMTSPAFYAIMISQFTTNYGSYTMMALLPTYMSTILKFNLSDSGFISALPYTVRFLLTLVNGYLCDFMITRTSMRKLTARKLCMGLASIVPAIFIVLAGYVGCNISAAITYLMISISGVAFVVPGYNTNVQDIAPRHAGVVMGISNTFGNIPGFLSPQVAGWILGDGVPTLAQWQTVFWVCAAVYGLGCASFCLLASAEEQSWAKGHENKQREELLNAPAELRL